MKSATLVMSGENSATLSIIAPLHAQLLDEMRSAASDSTVIKELKSAVHDNLRYTNLKEKLYVASALDPRFKTLPFISEEERKDTFTTLISSKDLIVLVMEAVHLYRSKNPLVKVTPPQPHQRGQKNHVRCWICLGQPMHQWLQ